MDLPPIHEVAGKRGPERPTMLKLKKKRRLPEGTLTTYCKVVKYLVSTSATDDTKAKKDAEMTKSKQTLNMSPVE